MHQRDALSALLAAAALAGCQNSSGATEPTRIADLASGNICNVTFEYDHTLLSPADVQLEIPPSGDRETFAVKLVPQRDVAQHGDHRCTDQESDEEHPCTLAEEPGLSLALLEWPYASYEAMWRASHLKDALHPSNVDGVPGLIADAGEEDGLQVRYILVPVDTRALLIKQQNDGETVRESAAIAAVIASLDLPG